MNKNLYYKEGKLRHTVLKLLLYTGVITPRSCLLLENSNSIRNALVKMKKDGIVEKSNNFEMFENINLQNFSNNFNEYIQDNFIEQDIEWFVKYGKSNVKNAKYKKIQNDVKRVLNNSEIVIMMYAAGVLVSPSDKAYTIRNKEFTENLFYQSREIKRYSGYKIEEEFENNEEYKSIASRNNGLLISKGGNYNIYHLGKRVRNWYTTGEYKIKGYEENLLSKYIKKDKSSCEINSAILVMYNLNTLNTIINNEKRASMSFDSLETVYPNIYAIPYDINGRDMIKIMKEADWQNFIYESIMEKKRNNEKLSVVCDYYEKDTYIFVFCVPDFTRYMYFINNAKKTDNPEKFLIICFDYQLDFVKNSSCGYARVQSIKMKEMMEVYDEFYK